MASQEEQKSSGGHGRGPSYPFISLKDAIAKIKAFYDQEGKALAPVSTAVEHWDYSEKSSGGRQMISTLLQYRLLRDEGSGPQRRVALTKLALDILLLTPQSTEWMKAVTTAARSPKLFSEILTHFVASGLPSDSSLKHYLITEMDISPSAVDTVIKNLRANIAFAKLLESDNATGEVDQEKDKNQDSVEVKVGDIVQWEPGGIQQFDPPRRVRGITDHEGSAWVFVEGSETGISVSELTVVGQAPKGAAPLLPEVVKAATLLQGEREWLRGPLSKDASYRLFVTGELASRELGKLIKLLKAQKSVLDDDEDEEDNEA
jgi:hypothetical protein